MSNLFGGAWRGTPLPVLLPPSLRRGGRGRGNNKHQATAGISTDAGWRAEMDFTELPLSNLYLTMLHKLGVETKSFGGSTETLSEV